MKTQDIFKNRYLRAGLFVLLGIILGWLFFYHSDDKTGISVESVAVKKQNTTIWTCAMHPQIRMDKPGKCPICGMDLIPLAPVLDEENDVSVVISETAMRLAGIQTGKVGYGKHTKMIQMYGRIVPDDDMQRTQTAHFPGRIEDLLVSTDGEVIKKGELIAKVYSPELITAQKELLEAGSLNAKYPGLLEAAREKLRNWKLSDTQINEIEKVGKVTEVFNLYADWDGTLIKCMVSQGDYISSGTIIYELSDLTRVWAEFDAYESDLPWLKAGQKLTFTSQAIPGKKFIGVISFIDPVLDAQTRVAKVRVELQNPEGILKPGIFLDGEVQAGNGTGKILVVPASAVLWTGKRSVVYVKTPGLNVPSFTMREITLGASLDNAYQVLSGLKEGEEIVTNGTFSVDAAAQLAGKPSMMNPDDSVAGTATTMPGMNMQGMKNDPSDAGSGEVSADFRKELTGVYNAYLPLKNALVGSDPAKASDLAAKVEKELAKVNMELLNGDQHTLWMKKLSVMNQNISRIANVGKLDEQRLAFGIFSQVFYEAIQTFGLDGVTTYYQFCPMANNNSGAYWLSEIKDIKNPYFGKAMLTCGETRDVIKPEK